MKYLFFSELLWEKSWIHEVLSVVAGGRIELPTRGFSIRCSTDWAIRPLKEALLNRLNDDLSTNFLIFFIIVFCAVQSPKNLSIC